MRHAIEHKQRVLAVAGPVVVHTGGVAGLSALIRGGWVHGLLSGNALGVHDVEAALLKLDEMDKQADQIRILGKRG